MTKNRNNDPGYTVPKDRQPPPPRQRTAPDEPMPPLCDIGVDLMLNARIRNLTKESQP